MVMENIDNIKNTDFDIPSDVLDEIQKNIQNIIEGFDIPDDNKMEVIKKINFMYTQTKQMSFTDPLTRLSNRRHFETSLEREYMRAKRYNSDLSVAIIDIDFFTFEHLQLPIILSHAVCQCQYFVAQTNVPLHKKI